MELQWFRISILDFFITSCCLILSKIYSVFPLVTTNIPRKFQIDIVKTATSIVYRVVQKFIMNSTTVTVNCPWLQVIRVSTIRFLIRCFKRDDVLCEKEIIYVPIENLTCIIFKDKPKELRFFPIRRVSLILIP